MPLRYTGVSARIVEYGRVRLRVGPKADFDAFYLLWAMTLKIVRAQWRRVVLMQTNREDVGRRYPEIRVPVPADRAEADRLSEPFRRYYKGIESARAELRGYLNSSKTHHYFLGDADEQQASADQTADEADTV